MADKYKDSEYEGMGAVINKPDALTDGRPAVIDHYDSRVKKFKVEVDSAMGGWIGWYTADELILDEPYESFSSNAGESRTPCPPN